MYANRADARGHWHNPDFAAARADKCVSCGACEPKCPQGIPIIADLARAHSELDAVKRINKK
jgi:predicted aldo/keto reductase-like oxidoreductase